MKLRVVPHLRLVMVVGNPQILSNGHFRVRDAAQRHHNYFLNSVKNESSPSVPR
jgi:hypothetical protein